MQEEYVGPSVAVPVDIVEPHIVEQHMMMAWQNDFRRVESSDFCSAGQVRPFVLRCPVGSLMRDPQLTRHALDASIEKLLKPNQLAPGWSLSGCPVNKARYTGFDKLHGNTDQEKTHDARQRIDPVVTKEFYHTR